MSEIRYMVGDVFEQMALLPDGSVDLIMTSPPFLKQRSYLPGDHPDKAKEIGAEPDPAAFVDALLRLTAEWRRLLTPHGTICVELGDTYSGSGGAGGDYNEGGRRAGQNAYAGSAARNNRNRPRDERPGRSETSAAHPPRPESPGGQGWPEPKCKAMIPELYRIALGYGIHPLTGEQSPAGMWKVRNVVTWCRPNPAVGALGDKFRPATSDMVIACTALNRWFDLESVRQPLAAKTRTVRVGSPPSVKNAQSPSGHHKMDRLNNEAGAPPLDYWVISPGGYEGAHFAVYPPELCIMPIQAMCPREVCRTCGEPRRRITARPNSTGVGTTMNRQPQDKRRALSTAAPDAATVTTLGWTDCGHDDYRNGVVLDPFAGSGTTLLVANGHGRDCIGIDIDERNLELARERIGPLYFNAGSAA